MIHAVCMVSHGMQDAKYKRRELLKTEAEVEGQIQDTSTMRTVKVLRKESLQRLCTSHLTKENEIDALREYMHRPRTPPALELDA